MKISYNWLKEYLNIDLPANTVSEILTDNGLEVEGIEEYEEIKGSLKGVVVGHILECNKMEGSDHLSITLVDTGNEKSQIVCGASNVAAGQKVMVALPGTTLHMTDGTSLTIKKAKLRGVESSGMICAEDELGLGQSHDGIMVLDPATPVGTEASKLHNIATDIIFEIGLTPNRSDAMCHSGVARDIYAALRQRMKSNDISFQLPSVDKFSKGNTKLDTTVELLNPEACIRYCGLTLSDLKVTESPSWLKNYLNAVGLRPINVVVDVTQFVMLEIGQPLHAFDLDKIEDRKVVIRFEKEGTPFVTLDGVERKLSAEDLMICDGKKGMCIAGVFGGNSSGVSMSTSKVFLESACFSPVYIRKTAKRHGLHTDASFRFERGTDPEIAIYALKRAATLLCDITGCSISSDIIDIYPKQIVKNEVIIQLAELEKFAGMSISANDALQILKDLDFEITANNNDSISMRVPLNRVDVLRDVDVYEEILRIYGYNNIPLPEKANTIYPIVNKLSLHKMVQRVSNYLSASGSQEIMCNSLSSLQWFEKTGVFDIKHIVKVQNPLSRELNVMRLSMLPGMLQSVAYNVNRNALSLKLYEIGRTYQLVSNDKEKTVMERFSEQNMLSICFTGETRPENWNYKSEKTGFFTMKSSIESLFRHLGLMEWLAIDDNVPGIFEYGASYILNNNTLASFGLVKKSICQLSDVDSDLWFAEINLDLMLKKLRKSSISFKEIARFPSMRRDLSLLIDKKVTFAQLAQAAKQAEKKLLKEVGLFDVYIDKKLGDDKKSYAVSFTFLNEEKTLTDKEIDKAMERIIASISQSTAAQIR